MPRLADGVEETAVVGRRKVDDLAVAGDRMLLVRTFGGNRRDVHRAPVAAVRHRAAQQGTQRGDGIKSLMWKNGAVHRVPAPARHVAAQPPGEIRHALVERAGHRVVAGLALRRPHIVTPGAVVAGERANGEARDE